MSDICNNSTLWMYIICGTKLVFFSVVSGLSLAETVADEQTMHLMLPPTVPLRVVAGVYTVIFMLKVLFSIGSIFGIKKAIPLLLSLYIGYAAFMSIVIFITSLLLLLIGYHWAAAVPIVLFNALYVTCLVKVYNGYETMIRAKTSGNLEHELLEEEWSPEDP